MKIKGNIVDIYERRIYSGEINIKDGKIEAIKKSDITSKNYILPGLVDAHIHIESSMVTPGNFAVEAVKHGTIGVVSDPHEIANVCGIDGINYMIEDSLKVPLKFYFGAPSCVPATNFETSGNVITSKQINDLLYRDDIYYLSEMMNFPGVIYGDNEVISKIEIAKRVRKPIDGHAPGLTGKDLKTYVGAGISTDHECSNLFEALEKISLGMKILIREGSAAKNLESLKELFNKHAEKVMLCSDDLHPEMLIKGHINKLIARLVAEGYNLFDVIKSASLNPKKHYKLKTGTLKIGDPADLIVVDRPETMNVLETWIDGIKVFEKNRVSFKADKNRVINKFNCTYINEGQIIVLNERGKIRIIEAIEGEIITKEINSLTESGKVVKTDVTRDYLKIIVKDRYNNHPPSVGFIKGFELKSGAFASSIAHDSHNIICVGVDDSAIVSAVNKVIDMQGGLAVSIDKQIRSLQLNIAGIMTTESCYETAQTYYELTNLVKRLGCKMAAPFMTLSFMALLVIPDLRIGDKGLFDVKKFEPVSLFC
jgi:adenine deaminase